MVTCAAFPLPGLALLGDVESLPTRALQSRSHVRETERSVPLNRWRGTFARILLSVVVNACASRECFIPNETRRKVGTVCRPQMAQVSR
jgi:hypothetical protein